MEANSCCDFQKWFNSTEKYRIHSLNGNLWKSQQTPADNAALAKEHANEFKYIKKTKLKKKKIIIRKWIIVFEYV